VTIFKDLQLLLARRIRGKPTLHQRVLGSIVSGGKATMNGSDSWQVTYLLSFPTGHSQLIILNCGILALLGKTFGRDEPYGSSASTLRM
jgi:hypothetical protein